MAKLTVLYKEEVSGGDYDAFGGYQDKVRVELRKWSSKSTKRTDYILSAFVLVDGETAVDNTKVLDGVTDSRAIRQAITKFDGLLASHPALSKPQPGPAEAKLVKQEWKCWECKQVRSDDLDKCPYCGADNVPF